MSINRITNLKEAKKYYMELSCSHFHMAREYPERYSEYKKQLISKEKEEQWTLEFISSKLNVLEIVYTSEELRSIFNEVNTAVKNTYNESTKEIYIVILEKIISKGDSFCKLIVLESMAQDTNIARDRSITYVKQFYQIAEKAINELQKDPYTYDKSTTEDRFNKSLNILEQKKIRKRITKAKEDISRKKSNII